MSPDNPEEGERTKRRFTYAAFADKIGLVPNFRRKDNRYQAIAVFVFVLIGAALGGLWRGWPGGVLAGIIGGLLIGGFVSGLVLMFVGLGRGS